MKALVTGATGSIGRKLVARLDQPRVLSRDPRKAERELLRVHAVRWGESRKVPDEALDGVDVIFHLAGEPVAEGRWSAEKKARIETSRVQGTRAVVDAIARSAKRPRVLVAASAVGIYGSRGDELLTEESPAGAGFLSEVCAAWEHEERRAEELGVRVVSARMGIVLDPKGGALAKMLPLFKLGVAGPLGDGKQWMPWIHVDDVVGLLLHAATHDDVRGPMNVCGPSPVTNADFTRNLAHAVSRPAFLRAPAFALRLALGEMATVVLSSQRVVPEVAARTGYRFQFADLERALADLLTEKPRGAAPGNDGPRDAPPKSSANGVHKEASA